MGYTLFDNRFNKSDMNLVAVDGTLLKALPKMLWALWLDEDHRAAKIHLEIDILKSIPLQAQVAEANTSEITQLDLFNFNYSCFFMSFIISYGLLNFNKVVFSF